MVNFYAGKKVLVTGGGGFIGSHLVERLLQLDADVSITQRSFPQRLRHVLPQVTCLQADLTLAAHCEKAVKRMDIVFDLAAQLAGINDNIRLPATLFHQNTLRTLNMLEASKNAKVERYFCASSTAIYSSQHTPPYKEEDGLIAHPDPTNLGYGWAKRTAELASKFYVEEFEMNISIARLANIYGPRDRFTGPHPPVIPSLIQKAHHAKDKIQVWGTGDQRRSFLYVKDAVDGILLLTEKSTQGEIYNLDSHEETSIKSLAEEIVTLSQPTLHIEFSPDMPQGQQRKSSDIQKLKKDLNWQPNYPLTKGLKETIQWYQNHAVIK